MGQSLSTFVLLLTLTACLLTLGPEFLYLKDNFGFRLNTIFKFYYQAWVLFGIAAIFALYHLSRTRPRPALIFLSSYHALLLIALFFPFYAVASRAMFYRGPVEAASRQPATLDGMAHLRLDAPDEYDAIMWLRQRTDGMPVVLEAVGPDGGQYSRDYGRVSAYTGLPTLIGWIGHENQWRGNHPEPAIRRDVVPQIYSQIGWDETIVRLLDRYDVGYIYVGRVERSLYPAEGLAKFDANLEVAFANDSVTIYRWRASETAMSN